MHANAIHNDLFKNNAIHYSQFLWNRQSFFTERSFCVLKQFGRRTSERKKSV